MIRRLAFLFVSLVVAYPVVSQTLVWKNYTSMYDINGVTISGDKVWAATTGGVFSYDPQTGKFEEYTTAEGLSNIQATAIVADSSTRVLVGEGDGSIDEIDSAGDVIRSQQDIAKFTAASKQITSLSVAGDTIFACTPFGVVLISRSNFGVLATFSHFDPSQGSITANAAGVFKGRIYVASQFGLSYAPRSAINLAAPDLWNLSDTLGLDGGVTSLAVFDGSLFVGTQKGLFSTSDGTTFQAVAGAPSGVIFTVSAPPGYLLVTTPDGLYRMDSGSSSFQKLYSGTLTLNSVAAYSDTMTFCSTSNGLLQVGSSTRLILPPGPATNTISNITVDQSGNLWCSTKGTQNLNVAFMKFNGSTWTNYNQQNFPALPGNQNIFQISSVCGNRLIIGTWGAGMVMVSGDSAKYFDNSNSTLVGIGKNAAYVVVGSAVCDQSGNIWMTNIQPSNGNVLDVYSPKDSMWYSFHDGLTPISGFIPIAIDAYGGVWTGDQFGDGQGNFYGLFYYNDNGTLSNTSDDISYIFNTSNSSLLSNRVTSVLVDNEDQVWIGTDLGLDVIYDPDPSSGFYIQSIYSLYDQYVNDVAYDALDHKWVATNTGVYEISNDGNTTLASYNTTNSPLPSDKVTAVACDRKDGIVYFATEYGITELKTGVFEPPQSFSKLKIYPDPARIPLPSAETVHIEGLVANSMIKIFTVNGRMVDQFAAQGGSVAYWNGTDEDGNLVPTGVYIIVAYSSDGSQSSVAKIAVIRH